MQNKADAGGNNKVVEVILEKERKFSRLEHQRELGTSDVVLSNATRSLDGTARKFKEENQPLLILMPSETTFAVCNLSSELQRQPNICYILGSSVVV